MSEDMERAAREAGFGGEAELHRLVASVNLSDPDTMRRFLDWRNNDGSKRGLLVILSPAGTA